MVGEMYPLREIRLFAVSLLALGWWATLSQCLSSSTVVLESLPVETPVPAIAPSPSSQCEWENFFAAHRRTVTKEDFFRCLYDLVPKEEEVDLLLQ